MAMDGEARRGLGVLCLLSSPLVLYQTINVATICVPFMPMTFVFVVPVLVELLYYNQCTLSLVLDKAELRYT